MTAEGVALRAIAKQSRSGGVSVATQAVAARHCGITQPRINDLVRGCLSRFSLDALVNFAAKLGQRVHVELEAA